MNGTLSKVLVGVSLAVMIALAVPLSLMTAAIIQGESPRQLAEHARMSENEAQSENNTGEPEQLLGEGDLYQKPEVSPDPGAASAAEPGAAQIAGKSLTDGNTVKSNEPASKPQEGGNSTGSKKQVSSKSAAPSSQSKSAQPTVPAPEPEPVTDPNEAPCMVEGMAEPPRVTGLPPVEASSPPPAEPIPVSPNAPCMVIGLDRENPGADVIPVSSSSGGTSSANSQSANSSGNNGSNGSWGEISTTNKITGSMDQTTYWVKDGKSYHFLSSCPSLSRSTNIQTGTLQDAINAGKTDPCNNCANGS